MKIINKVKKIIKNPKKLILHINWVLIKNKVFNSLSDEKYLKYLYFIRMGKKLNLDNPISFNEKLQWLKIYDRKPIYTNMVDKYEAKKYVANIIGEEYIIPTIGVWESFDDINFNLLPNQFVLKCTHDSGGLVICKDKSVFNVEKAKEKIVGSLKNNYFYSGREWPYKNISPKIIAEKYMEDEFEDKLSITGLIDYKFYCFNGKVRFLYVSKGLENHSTANISFLTLDWNFAPFCRIDYNTFKELPKKPLQFSKMIEIAEMLSEKIAFLRVDLYEINNMVYFSELTFTPCSGFIPFQPEEWDDKLGDWIELPKV